MKTLWGRKLSCWGVGSGVWVVCQSTGELSEVVVWLVFRLQDNLLGNLEKLDGFRWGLIIRSFGSAVDWEFEVLTRLGKKVSAPLGICNSKFLLRWGLGV